MSNDAPFGYSPGTTIPRKRKPVEYEGRGQCRHCGTTGLVWELHGDRWRLTDLGGKRHECPKGAR